MSEQRPAPPGHLRLLTREDDREPPEDVPPGGGTTNGPALADESIRVLTVAGQALVRASYRALLERDEHIEVVGEAPSAQHALALALDASPHVALLDVGLTGLDDPPTAAALISHPAFAQVAVMLIAARADDDRVLSAVRAGAVGVLFTDAEPDELIRTVRLLADGDALLPAEVVRGLLAELPPAGQRRFQHEHLEELTDREREVVGLVATGLSNSEIAEQLVISPATAKTHVSRAMVKVHARDRAQLVVLAYEAGLITAPTHGARAGDGRLTGRTTSARKWG